MSSLAFGPKLLGLDEPFSGLDPLMRDKFFRCVREVSALGDRTVLVSSHAIDEAERLADHVAMIEGGGLTLKEATEALSGRFRRVEVTGAPASAGAVEGGLEWERAGRSPNLWGPTMGERSRTGGGCGLGRRR